MRAEPIRDPEGDRVFAQEQAERALERGDSPLTHMPHVHGQRENPYKPEPTGDWIRDRYPLTVLRKKIEDEVA